MPRFPGAPKKREGPISRNGKEPATHRLAELGNHISAAQKIAEAEGEQLLAFLLAMAFEEHEIAARRRLTGQPAPAASRRP